MYETIKIINGYSIIRMTGTKGFYTVYIADDKYVTFKTIKSAVEYVEKMVSTVA